MWNGKENSTPFPSFDLLLVPPTGQKQYWTRELPRHSPWRSACEGTEQHQKGEEVESMHFFLNQS